MELHFWINEATGLILSDTDGIAQPYTPADAYDEASGLAEYRRGGEDPDEVDEIADPDGRPRFGVRRGGPTGPTTWYQALTGPADVTVTQFVGDSADTETIATGRVTAAGAVAVVWPDGNTQTFADLGVAEEALSALFVVTPDDAQAVPAEQPAIWLSELSGALLHGLDAHGLPVEGKPQTATEAFAVICDGDPEGWTFTPVRDDDDVLCRFGVRWNDDMETHWYSALDVPWDFRVEDGPAVAVATGTVWPDGTTVLQRTGARGVETFAGLQQAADRYARGPRARIVGEGQVTGRSGFRQAWEEHAARATREMVAGMEGEDLDHHQYRVDSGWAYDPDQPSAVWEAAFQRLARVLGSEAEVAVVARRPRMDVESVAVLLEAGRATLAELLALDAARVSPWAFRHIDSDHTPREVLAAMESHQGEYRQARREGLRVGDAVSRACRARRFDEARMPVDA